MRYTREGAGMRKWRTEKKRELRKEQQGIDLETEKTKTKR